MAAGISQVQPPRACPLAVEQPLSSYKTTAVGRVGGIEVAVLVASAVLRIVAVGGASLASVGDCVASGTGAQRCSLPGMRHELPVGQTA
ncbi:MAG TPA: hypothetical protein VEB21_04935 [Terriglobales bacterium]|nr:hypothetical protein [Terriglobales bacterium]